jgi:hypothetical protein
MFERLVIGLAIAIASAVVVGFVLPSKEYVLDECRMSALKGFGHLRKKNDLGYAPFQTELEDRYVDLCMDAHGFTLDQQVMERDRAPTDAHLVGTENRSMWMSDPAHWKRTTFWPRLGR